MQGTSTKHREILSGLICLPEKGNLDIDHFQIILRSISQKNHSNANITYNKGVEIPLYGNRLLLHCLPSLVQRIHIHKFLRIFDLKICHILGMSVYDLFSAFAEVGESRDKAFPDLYLLAAERMDVEPHCCVVFEDIVKGIRGAKGAGMKTVGVYDETSAYQWPLMCQMADKCVRSLEELL